jgi:hypothetical protein
LPNKKSIKYESEKKIKKEKSMKICLSRIKLDIKKKRKTRKKALEMWPSWSCMCVGLRYSCA